MSRDSELKNSGKYEFVASRWIVPLLGVTCLSICLTVIVICAYLWTPGHTSTRPIIVVINKEDILNKFPLEWESNADLSYTYNGSEYSLNINNDSITVAEGNDSRKSAVSTKNSITQFSPEFEIINGNGKHKTMEIDQTTIIIDSCSGYQAFAKNGAVYLGRIGEKFVEKISPDNDLIHGEFDWIYTEEIHDREHEPAIWFPSCKPFLAFTSYKKVGQEVQITTSYNEELPYPTTTRQRYAVVGEPVTEYSISIADLKTKKVITMKYETPNKGLLYILNSQWISNGAQFFVTWTNRLQNEVYFTTCDYHFGFCNLVTKYQFKEKQWAEPSYLTIHSGRNHLYFVKPNEKGDLNSIGRINLSNGKLDTIETSHDVDQIRQISSSGDDDVIFYEAPLMNNSLEDRLQTNQVLHLFSVRASDGVERCESCQDQINALSRFTFSPDKKSIAVISHNRQSISLMVLDRNNSKMSVKHEHKITKRSPFQDLRLIEEYIDLGDGFEAHAVLVHQKKYSGKLPVLLYVYAGPNSNMAMTNSLLEPITRFSENYAVLVVDGRGSGLRGWKYRSAIYGKLGTVEMEDQLFALKKMLEKYPYLDPERLTVYGHSYGGFAALHISQKAPQYGLFFKCAISGAAVTHFKYYDAIYTERYMGSSDPDDQAYSLTDATFNVGVYHKTHLLVMHGMADDNVHFHHCARLLKALNKLFIPYDLKLFPESTHGFPSNYIIPFLQEKQCH